MLSGVGIEAVAAMKSAGIYGTTVLAKSFKSLGSSEWHVIFLLCCAKALLPGRTRRGIAVKQAKLVSAPEGHRVM